MIDVSLLGAFYLWARGRSLLLLILKCLSPGLVTHIRITYGLLFGHWSHKHKLVCVEKFRMVPKVRLHIFACEKRKNSWLLLAMKRTRIYSFSAVL